MARKEKARLVDAENERQAMLASAKAEIQACLAAAKEEDAWEALSLKVGNAVFDHVFAATLHLAASNLLHERMSKKRALRRKHALFKIAEGNRLRNEARRARHVAEVEECAAAKLAACKAAVLAAGARAAEAVACAERAAASCSREAAAAREAAVKAAAACNGAAAQAREEAPPSLNHATAAAAATASAAASEVAAQKSALAYARLRLAKARYKALNKLVGCTPTEWGLHRRAQAKEEAALQAAARTARAKTHLLDMRAKASRASRAFEAFMSPLACAPPPTPSQLCNFAESPAAVLCCCSGCSRSKEAEPLFLTAARYDKAVTQAQVSVQRVAEKSQLRAFAELEQRSRSALFRLSKAAALFEAAHKASAAAGGAGLPKGASAAPSPPLSRSSASSAALHALTAEWSLEAAATACLAAGDEASDAAGALLGAPLSAPHGGQHKPGGSAALTAAHALQVAGEHAVAEALAAQSLLQRARGRGGKAACACDFCTLERCNKGKRGARRLRALPELSCVVSLFWPQGEDLYQLRSACSEAFAAAPRAIQRALLQRMGAPLDTVLGGMRARMLGWGSLELLAFTFLKGCAVWDVDRGKVYGTLFLGKEHIGEQRLVVFRSGHVSWPTEEEGVEFEALAGGGGARLAPPPPPGVRAWCPRGP